MGSIWDRLHPRGQIAALCAEHHHRAAGADSARPHPSALLPASQPNGFSITDLQHGRGKQYRNNPKQINNPFVACRTAGMDRRKRLAPKGLGLCWGSGGCREGEEGFLLILIPRIFAVPRIHQAGVSPGPLPPEMRSKAAPPLRGGRFGYGNGAGPG